MKSFITKGTWIVPFPCMNFQMCSQMTFPKVGSPTSVAYMWSLYWIWMSFHVICKAATLTVWFVTHRTDIRSLPCMNSKMGSQITFVSKTLPTSRACMWGLLWMSFHVSGKVDVHIERFIAYRRGVKGFPCMDSMMSFQVFFQLKGLSRSGAHMWSILWMQFHVLCEMTLLNEAFVTQRTSKYRGIHVWQLSGSKI